MTLIPEKKMSAVLYPQDRNMEGLWFLKVKVRNYDTGKYVYKKYSGLLNRYQTLEERMAKAAEYIGLFEKGIIPPDMQGMRYIPAVDAPKNFANTVQLCEKHISKLSDDVESGTYGGYCTKLREFKRWMTEQNYSTLPIGQFHTGLAEEFLFYLKINRKYKNTTINDYKSVMAKIWRAILKHEIEIKGYNPWINIESRKDDRISYAQYSPAQEKKVMQELPGYNKQMWLFIQFMYYEFMRPSEVFRLKLHNVNWNIGTMDLDNNIVKKSKGRTAVIPYPLVKEMLLMDYDKLDPDYYIFSHGGQPGSKKLGKNYMSRKWAKFRKEFNIPDSYMIYGWKHTGNNKLAQTGLNPVLLKEHNGHASLDQTATYIGKINISHKIPIRETFPEIGTDLQKPDEAYQRFINEINEKRSAI